MYLSLLEVNVKAGIRSGAELSLHAVHVHEEERRRWWLVLHHTLARTVAADIYAVALCS